MARYALIDGYLETMRSRIPWRDDLDDLVAEMEDHLYSTTEGLCARGLAAIDAQRATLDRFGDPSIVQAAFASNDRGGIAMPTTFTNRAGTLALVSAGLWVLATMVVAVSTYSDSESLALYIVVAGLVTAAGALGLGALVGLGSRVGGLGAVGFIGLVITGVGVLASFAVTWAIPLWMTIEGIGTLLIAFSARRSTEVPQFGLVAIGSGFLVGSTTFFILRTLEVGWRDAYSDYPLAWFLGAAVGAITVAVGLAVIGRWLAGEDPADIDATPLAA